MKSQTFSILIILFYIVLTSCSDDKKIEQKEEVATTENQVVNNDNKDLWSNIPLYEGVILEDKKGCPGKWSNCEECELRIYVTEDEPVDVCSYYKEEMKNREWMKITYQFYPEGSCLATWMKDDKRVFFNTTKRRADNKTVISITIGRDCP